MFNPFFILGYGGPEYFCDRESETTKLANALINNRNVAFISERRLGKTALILHTFNRLKSTDDNIRCFYIDIFKTQNQADFVSVLGSKVLGELDSLSEKVIARISTFLKSCRPMFSFDPTTNTSEVSLSLENVDSQTTLSEILQYMEQSGYECYVAIDEFQQIREYPEKGIEAFLRSEIQFLHHVHFVFAGSKRHVMADMFSSPKKPFYQSCQKIGLTPLPRDTYYEFCARLFGQAGSKLPREIFDRVYSFAKGYTWYIQDLMNRLYALQEEVIRDCHLASVLGDIESEGEVIYKDYCELFSAGQMRLLRAIAAEDAVAKPFEQSFMQRHRLTAVSSVKQALKVLTESGIVTQSDDGYFISDRYFSLWL